MISKLVKKLTPEIIKKPLRSIKRKIDLQKAIVLNVTKSEEVGEIFKVVKAETLENAYFPKIYSFFSGGKFEFVSPALKIFKYQNSVVFSQSDFVLANNKLVWHKFHLPQFTKSVPQDQNLLAINGNEVHIKRYQKPIEVKIGYSLCGVYCDVWAHFLIQFLPKIYFIAALQEQVAEPITIIVPNYKDAHIREIVFDYLSKLKNIKILELGLTDVAHCETLYHLDNTAYITDTAKYISPSDINAPKFVAELLQQNLIEAYLPAKEETKRLNVYISRKGGRNILNQYEVEKYFKEKHFTFIEPHLLSFREKIALFRQADCVVGPCSSGFMNIIFCKPGTKMLSFINFARSFESYFGFLSEYFKIDMMLVTGIDDQTEDINSSYTIPLEKIKAACKEMGI